MKRGLITAAKVGCFVLLVAAILMIVPGFNGSKSQSKRAEWVDINQENFIKEVILSDRPTIIAVLYERGNASEVMAPIYEEVKRDFPQIKYVRLKATEENLPLMKALGIEPDFQPMLIVLNHAFTEKPAAIPGVYTREMIVEVLLPLTYAQTLKPGKGLGEALLGGAAPGGDETVTPAPTPNNK